MMLLVYPKCEKMTRGGGALKKMRKTGVAWGLLGLALLVLGAVSIGCVLGRCEELLRQSVAQNQLTAGWKAAAWQLALSGGLVVSGLGILLALALHRFRRAARIQREAEALRRREEAAEALNRQNQQLQHHQRLHIIGTLTSSIAHEFNNLLTPIMGYSLMALEKLLPEDEALYDDILEIYNASRKAKTIISRLSDLSRKNTDATFRQVSLDDLVHKTLDVAAPAKPEGVEVRLNLNCWEQRIRANEIQLSQLLLNLVLNSFDAMGETGVLEIRTSFDERSVELVVGDSGCGIPQDVLPGIFEPFFTTKESGKGTGLGLAIVAQVVEDHQGTITVESRTGEGTVFTVRLPRTPEAPAAAP